jgi:hypothetical protein
LKEGADHTLRKNEKTLRREKLHKKKERTKNKKGEGKQGGKKHEPPHLALTNR